MGENDNEHQGGEGGHHENENGENQNQHENGEHHGEHHEGEHHEGEHHEGEHHEHREGEHHGEQNEGQHGEHHESEHHEHHDEHHEQEQNKPEDDEAEENEVYGSPIVEPVDGETNDSPSQPLDNGDTSPDHKESAPAPAPPLPNRSPVPSLPAAPPLPPRKRQPFFWLRGKTQSSLSNISFPDRNSSGTTHRTSGSSLSSPDYDLLLHRLDANNEGLQSRDAREKDASATGIRQIQQHFAQVKEQEMQTAAGADSEGLKISTPSIDWQFWSLVISDYAHVARTRPLELAAAISHGFPTQLRGLIWQLIASSKSSTLEEVYQSIVQEPSPHEKAIKRDLSRTSFIKNANSDSLFRIIKGYSLFDPEVGYTQGMAFIAVPLLINMSEPEAFCLLVRFMKDYSFRTMFLPEMPGLHLRLYQFDRIIEDTIPTVHVHLARQGVRSSMYASQWFLTLFAYKFPLQIVMRIFDIVITEGIEAILRFAVALIKKNASHIQSLEFDAVLTFLKERIFDQYVIDQSHLGNEPEYQVNELVNDAYEVKLLPVTLRKYENEYIELHRIERERVEEVESLRQANGVLTLQVRRLETSMAALNQEHIEVANEMVQGRLEIARLKDENEQLVTEIEDFKLANEDQSKLADKDLREKSELLETQNAELIETKDRLENQLNNLEKDLLETKTEFATLEDAHTALRTRWATLKKQMEGF